MSAEPLEPATVENRTNTGVSTDVSHRIGAHVRFSIDVVKRNVP